jgi:hypothetical protein
MLSGWHELSVYVGGWELLLLTCFILWNLSNYLSILNLDRGIDDVVNTALNKFEILFELKVFFIEHIFRYRLIILICLCAKYGGILIRFEHLKCLPISHCSKDERVLVCILVDLLSHLV